jgi:hypothetical protein
MESRARAISGRSISAIDFRVRLQLARDLSF